MTRKTKLSAAFFGGAAALAAVTAVAAPRQAEALSVVGCDGGPVVCYAGPMFPGGPYVYYYKPGTTGGGGGGGRGGEGPIET